MTRAAAAKLPADAAGITDAGKTKTSTAVDALTAPPAVPTGDADRIVHIPTGRIRNHPHNRKVTEDDVADLVASIKTDGIINPLGVTAAADWNVGKPDDLAEIPPGEYVITAGGHRRLLAAELAKLPTVPCIVRADFAGAKGRRAALLENLHRLDLDAFEEAEAFAELTGPPYKLSQRDLAALCNVTQPHISRRLKLLKLPSAVRAKYDAGKLKIGDCLELTRLAHEPKLLEQILVTIGQGYYGSLDRLVDRTLEQFEADKVKTAEVERLTAAGVKVLDRAPDYHLSASSRQPVRLDALGIKTAAHKKEPCHAAYVTTGYNGKLDVTYSCTQPKRHQGKKAESTVKATKTASAGTTMSDKEKAGKKRRAEIKKTVNPARRAIVAQLVQHGGFDAETRRQIVTQSVIFRLLGGYSTADSDVAVTLLGIEPAVDRNGRCYPHDLLEKYAATAKPDLLALAGALTYFETRLNDPNTYSPWTDVDRWYLDLLAANGYTVTDAEHEQLRDVRGEDGTWAPPPVQEAPDDVVDDPQCATCRTYADELPAGVMMVADNLCSACSDAKDAGWVAPEEPAAVESEHRTCEDCSHDVPQATCTCASCLCASAAACPGCNGFGRLGDGEPCTRCQGDGVVDVAELAAVSA